jgi:protein-L-isoaspartate(D-aspartate) O-methyltransferase
MKIDYDFELKQMIDDQIIRRGIADKRVLNAIRSVPRHIFVSEDYQHLAYSDGPLPIGFGQTISQPYIVALMVSELHLTGSEKVLEVGSGCGYQAAILAHMARKITTLEIIPELAKRAEHTIDQLKLLNVQVICGDGSLGCLKDAPYDAILISAAAPKVPEPLLEQLAEGGRLIIPVGSRGFQQLEIWSRIDKKLSSEVTISVAFVPLRGKHGWQNKIEKG